MAGGSRAHDQGYFIEPTVFADVSDDMTIAREEIFGPVMSIMKFSDIDEVVQRANNTDYGLAAAIYSSDFPKARQVAKKVRRYFALALRLPCGSDLGDCVTEQLSD